VANFSVVTVKRWVRYKRQEWKVAHLPIDGAHPWLDVGCGSFPLPDADFVGDLTPQSFDLPEMQDKLRGRFVRLDLHYLPFGDRTFGFVHCSNVLEHMEEPGRAIAELKRVSRHGFVETPRAFFDNVLIHSKGHRWIVSWKGSEIMIDQPKQRWIGVFQILPLPFSPWIRNKHRLLWKILVNILDFMGLAFQHYKW